MRNAITIFFIGCIISSIGQVPPNADSVRKKLAHHTAHDTTRVILLNQLAFGSYYINPITTLESAFEARRLADSLNFTSGQAEAYRQAGMAFWAQSDFTTAINYYLTGLRIAKANKHKQIEADILGNIGTGYNGMNNPEEALNYLNPSIALQQELKNEWREAAIVNNVGDAYVMLHDFEKARAAYNKGMLFSIRNNFRLGITTNMRNLGNILEIEGKLDSALLNYEQALGMSMDINDSRGVVLSYKSIASVYIKQNKLSHAKLYLNNALQAAQKVKLRAFMRDAYELLNQIAELEHDNGKAYEYYKLYSHYKDSVQNLRAVSDIAAARVRFETDQKQNEIELLVKDGELQKTKIQYQRNQIWGISVTLLFALIFLVFGIYNYKKLRSQNGLLENSKSEIENKNILLSDQREELSNLNAELRMQQLQVISHRDQLLDKNLEVEKMHNEVIRVNQNLERLVSVRTQVLIDQNKRLTDYSFFNAHQLRAPVASIMGLVNLLQHSSSPEEYINLLNHLETSARKLDETIRNINDSIQEGIQQES